MATDIGAVIENLTSFYDFDGRSVVHVGAGGGQLIGYAPRAGSVFCVDSDAEAIEHLDDAIRSMGLSNKFTVVHGDFLSVCEAADVVFFEFCLHEMDDPGRALLHAASLAPETLVLDHAPDSEWAWHTCETEKAARSWAAVESLYVVRAANFKAMQHFGDHAQLVDRVGVLGPEAVGRAARYSGRMDIEIEMGYAMALLSRAGE